MTRKLLFLFLLFLALTSVSQEKRVLISGKIIDSLGVVKNANIINLKTNQGTFSMHNGSFNILVAKGDSLQISSVQHLTKKIKISNTNFQVKSVLIKLEQNTYILDEFELKRHELIGSISVDLNLVPQKKRKDINAITLNLPNAGIIKMKYIDKKMYTARNQPLNLVLNSLSGRLKKLKIEKKISEEDEDVNLMYKMLKHYFKKDFNIEKEDTFKFLYYSRNDTLFNKSLLKNELKLIKFLQLKAKEFNKINEAKK